MLTKAILGVGAMVGLAAGQFGADVNCVAVTSGATASGDGPFYPTGGTTGATFVRSGETFSAAGQFCAFGEWLEVSAGEGVGHGTVIGANSANPTHIKYGSTGTTNYFTTETTSLAAVCNINTFQSNSAMINEMPPNSSPEFAARFEKSQTIDGQAGCETAAASTAIRMGDSSMGGIVAVGTFMNTGTAACTAGVNHYDTPVANGCGKMCDGTDCQAISGVGTQNCVEADFMCIGTAGSGVPPEGNSGTGAGSCTARSFAAGTVKYSLMLHATGSSFNWGSVTCSGTATTHVAVRQVFFIGPLGITVNDVTFNDGTKTASTIGATDITNMQLGGVTLGFDTQYNYGTFSSPAGFSTSGTDGAVKVRYTAVGNEMFYIDYVFDITHLNAADTWIAYDPTVQGSGGNSGSSSGSSLSAGATAGVVVAVLVVVVLAVVVIGIVTRKPKGDAPIVKNRAVTPV